MSALRGDIHLYCRRNKAKLNLVLSQGVDLNLILYLQVRSVHTDCTQLNFTVLKVALFGGKMHSQLQQELLEIRAQITNNKPPPIYNQE